MSEGLCSTSLAINVFWGWVIAAGGVALVVASLRAGIVDVSFQWEGKKLRLHNATALVTGLAGLVFLVVGLGAVIGGSSGAAARWFVDNLPQVVERADVRRSLQLHNEPLREILKRTDRAAEYTIDVAPQALEVTVSGDYHGSCDADIMNQICRAEKAKLACKVDRESRTVRICNSQQTMTCQ